MLAVCANCIAETLSRKVAPRNIWDKDQSSFTLADDDDEDDHDDENAAKSALSTEQPIQHKPIPFCSNMQPAAFTPNPFRNVAAFPSIARPAFSL
jgi:hypothetical protein